MIACPGEYLPDSVASCSSACILPNPACLSSLPNLDGNVWLCSLGYFRFYVVLGFIFLTAATAIGIFLPIWEARDLFFRVGLFWHAWSV